uniref:Heterochromatin protein 1-binding protein 3 n=1 Tax=Oryzias latipes TaxID=8090 RepID=A0A3P9IZH2_ORYLA
MPIRRAAATPSQEKAPAAAADKGEPVNAPPPDSGGEGVVRGRPGVDCSCLPLRARSLRGASSDKSGVSFKSLMKYLLDKHPGMELTKKTFFIKKALKKHLEKGTIKQLKGKGLSGSFVIGKQPAPPKLESLGDALPLIITQLCEPKEASYNLIKKYLEQHFPSLNIENKPESLKTALVKAVEKGHLEQITGKGARGTFQLKRGGNKPQPKGSVLEEAITVAITAMNEPKTCSTTLLKSVLVLKRDITVHCKVLGWMEQITGHGFTGTYRLSFPFYPSPNTLFPDKFKEPAVKTPAKRRRTVDSSEEEEESEEEESSEDEALPPKRYLTLARRPPPAKKARSSGPVKSRGKAFAKKSPAKKAPPPAKKAGRKQPASKKEAAPPKETPVKKAAPSRKPKTPAVKKLSARGSKRPPPKESTPEKDDKTAKSRSRSSRSEESSPEEPAAKKQPAKGKRSQPKKTPPTVKTGAKSSKQPARQSKRGRR